MANLYKSRKIIKINSSKLKLTGDKLTTFTLGELRGSNGIVGMAPSYIIRTLDIVAQTGYSEEVANQLKSEIKQLKSTKNIKSNREKLREKQNEYFKLLYFPYLVNIHIDKAAHYQKLNKGFSIRLIDERTGEILSEKKYTYFLSTSASIKKNEVFYIDEEYAKKMECLVDNGHNPKEFVPAKLSAYRALTMSASNPVTNTPNVLVVNDVETKFKTSVLEMDGSKQEEPIRTRIDDYEMTLNCSDGCGYIDPKFAKVWASDLHLDYVPSGFITRNAFCKGVLMQFPYKEFCETKNLNPIVKDIWGKEWNINEVDVVLTTSMLKLANCYDSWEHYWDNCIKNHYTFSVTKYTPKVLDVERSTNYQFIQSLNLTDEEIKSFIKPTIDEIKEIKGYDTRKALAFLRGMSLNEDSEVLRNDFTTALMINPTLIHEPSIRSQINSMIKKKIAELKKGVVKVKGNYQTITIDPIILAENIFGLESKGLLKPNELHSKFWQDRQIKEVAVARAPMVSMSNLAVVNIAYNEEANYWYRYLDQMIVLNGWDSLCTRESGADLDGDSFFTTSNEYMIKGIRETLPVVCIQNSAPKKLCSITDFQASDYALINSKVENVGVITNRATAIQNVQSKFPMYSKEWEELEYRIQACIMKSQDSIDVAKGIDIPFGFPKSWISNKVNKVSDDDTQEIVDKKEYNMSLVADKKPYFFIYVYDHLKKEYLDFIKKEQSRCKLFYGKTLEELLGSPTEELTEEELNTIKFFNIYNPVDNSPSLMNKIAWFVEEEFKNLKLPNIANEEHRESLKSGLSYQKANFKKILPFYSEYVFLLQSLDRKNKQYKTSSDDKEACLYEMISDLKNRMLEVVSNEEELCNIVIDIAYSNKRSKNFAWQLFGEQIIKNLLKNNNYTVSYPVMCDDENKEFEYKGLPFKMHTKKVGEENEING